MSNQQPADAVGALPEQSGDLEAELKACLPVLPQLSRQLLAVLAEVNGAVGGVCSRFQDVGINALQVAHGTIKAPELSQAVSQQLLRDLSLIIVSLQFEDRISQQIRHVARTLEQMHESLSARLPASAGATECEAASALPAEPGSDVELF